jgi:molybdopterin converting factor small subunit
MVVSIQPHGALREHIQAGVTLENVQTAGEAIERLSIPGSMGLAILVNGRLADWNTPLHDGDIVQLVPQICGG